MTRLTVKVTPNAKKTEVLGWTDDDPPVLRLKLAAPPVDGKANQALIAFLAKSLGVPKRAVTLERGASNRTKMLAIEGVDDGALRAAF